MKRYRVLAVVLGGLFGTGCPPPGPEVADGGATDGSPTMASYPPAAVFISSGGGTAVSGQGRLGVSLPGAAVVGGAVQAPSGARLQLGFFASDSIE